MPRGEHFSAGEPGDLTKAFRTVNISIHDGKGGIGYTPRSLVVHLGEQIKFVISNDGLLGHEFILASTEDNLKHAALMKEYPDMEHDDPNGKTTGPYNIAEILWRFRTPSVNPGPSLGGATGGWRVGAG
jgi:uncharacterized cupredoxin-like copper-binding protein